MDSTFLTGIGQKRKEKPEEPQELGRKTIEGWSCRASQADFVPVLLGTVLMAPVLPAPVLPAPVLLAPVLPAPVLPAPELLMPELLVNDLHAQGVAELFGDSDAAMGVGDEQIAIFCGLQRHLAAQ